MVESGLLEIYRFLPPALLEDFDIEEIGLDEFLRYVAKARYIQELEERIVAQAIADVFAIAWLKSEYVLTASFTKSPTLTAAKAAVAIFAAFPIESSFLLTPPTLFSSEL